PSFIKDLPRRRLHHDKTTFIAWLGYKLAERDIVFKVNVSIFSDNRSTDFDRSHILCFRAFLCHKMGEIDFFLPCPPLCAML
ncbi:MAG: hypothetical protein IJS55_07175, partial [Oscillospiraceae bacterium]|nr:hypothetical protein [Oscillospiraceae bacterium]